MFSGIVQAVGTVAALEAKGVDVRLQINTEKLAVQGLAPGDSVSVSGVCLTAVTCTPDQFCADVSGETLRQTVLGELSSGDLVNLETALTLNTLLGGHLVTGHVDGVGTLKDRHPDGRSERMRIRAPDTLSRYIARKGSICVDGVSLTVNEVDGSEFEVNIVPFTLEETTLGSFRAGRRVNLEVDIIARYLERLLSGEAEFTAGAHGTITRELLTRFGYIEDEANN
ncbi:MAG: riboflavin synthase [Gammaproteobacteria bacterium]